MKKSAIKTLKILFIGLLMLNIGIYGCFTTMMWKEKQPAYQTVAVNSGHEISVIVLNENEIAVLPKRNDAEPFNNMATIYTFHKDKYESIKDNIQSVRISENIYLSFKDKTVQKNSGAYFIIALKGEPPVEAIYKDVTLTNRTDKEIEFDDSRIFFNRKVFAENEPSKDLSWLWKIPLTPVTVAADAATAAVAVVGGAALIVVGTPVMLINNLSHHGQDK